MDRAEAQRIDALELEVGKAWTQAREALRSYTPADHARLAAVMDKASHDPNQLKNCTKAELKLVVMLAASSYTRMSWELARANNAAGSN